MFLNISNVDLDIKSMLTNPSEDNTTAKEEMLN